MESSFSVSFNKSTSLKSAIPVAVPLSDKIPVIEKKVCVLPDPDSPAIPRHSPCYIEKDILSTALIKPCDVSKLTLKSLTFNIVCI